ncbi:glycosyltransferase family 4 protein, partial [Avibacterium avium]
MKVAIIHYWLINQRGGEKVLESLCEIFPNADIFTHVYDESKFYDSIISRHNVYTSFINKLPFSKKFYQYYLPLMPYALENLDLDEYDLIISSESGPAKGVITNPHAIHICYCHSPMRYAWDMHSMYSQGFGLLKKILFSFFIHHIRRWDQLNSTQVDYFVANSKFIASRIKKFYSRDCEI